ncbi:MAG: class I SAM-dependent methyltransferase [Synergistaceae bacterium]|nr:class I SAM-dependent methyltransferase [Synergistaceae bacterium]
MDTDDDIPYSEDFYSDYAKIVSSLDTVVSLIMRIANPASVVDFGCAVGGALSCFKEKGVSEILGVDGFWVKEEQLLIAKDEFIRHDFNKGFLSLPKKYDLAISTEVAEHVEDANADAFIETLINASDIIVFSAAVPGQGGTNHVNEQWPQYWIDKFSKHDFVVIDCIREYLWNNDDVPFLYRQNLLLFCKNDKTSLLSLPEITSKRYDIIHPVHYERKLFQLFNLFSHLYEQGQNDAILQLSILKDFDYSAKFYLGLVYNHNNEYEKCIECLEGFAELSGASSFGMLHIAYFALGVAYYQTHNPVKAKHYIEKCLQNDNEYNESAKKLLAIITADEKLRD